MSNKIEKIKEIKTAVSGYKISDEVKNELLTMLDELEPGLKTETDKLYMKLGKFTYKGFNQTQGDYYEDGEVVICNKIKELKKEKERL